MTEDYEHNTIRPETDYYYYAQMHMYQDYDEIEWFIPGPLSGDLIAGMVTATRKLPFPFARVYPKTKNIPYTRVEIQNDPSLVSPEIIAEAIDNILSDPTSLDLEEDIADDHVLDEYLVVDDIHLFDIPDNEYLEQGYYYIWIGQLPRYNLYKFRSPDFLRGFITMANASGVDYRTYVHGKVFDINRKYDIVL